jgi:predicted site-specific integrase-resolvase
MYGVQEFAALAGVTVKALHHYDRLGLLKPRRTDAGYRLYSQRDLTRLKEISATCSTVKLREMPTRKPRSEMRGRIAPTGPSDFDSTWRRSTMPIGTPGNASHGLSSK